MLSIQNVTKIYQPFREPIFALQNINIEIKKGDFVAISGASGSGKTTLFKLVAGLENVTEGNILFENQSIIHFSEKEKTKFRLHQIGFIFQQHHLIPVLSALENVSFLLEMQGKTQKEAKKISQEWLEKVNILECANRKPHQLSGGQQQRVAIARALAGNPKLILADEPTASLDEINTELLLDLMKSLNQQEDITFLVATHDERVRERASKTIFFKNGKII
jgi:putative ABC transport system ATP-binding protein